MKKTFLIFIAISFCGVAFNQTIEENKSSESTFVIRELGTSYTLEKIQKAISEADWCGYFFENERHQIKLDDGSIVEFKSAQELNNINAECISCIYKDEKKYSIHSSGRILIQASSNPGVKSYSK